MAILFACLSGRPADRPFLCFTVRQRNESGPYIALGAGIFEWLVTASSSSSSSSSSLGLRVVQSELIGGLNCMVVALLNPASFGRSGYDQSLFSFLETLI